ncbi:hypothetical protein MKX03_005777 [Papaver bracteatum]|nr:hypothetical protein MKX03_005777 [Papaver bracteatum]
MMILILTLDSATKNRIRSPWRRCLIRKVMGKTVGFKFIQDRINLLWKPLGQIQILDLGKDFFLFKFSELQDLKKAMLDGPWFIGGHYLSLRRWSPEFKPTSVKFSTTIVWIRLPELPIEFFDKEVLFKIGNRLGKPIKVDYTTENMIRGRFARLCVEIELLKPLIPVVKIGKLIQCVEYEGLTSICFECGRENHRAQNCPLKKTDHDENLPKDSRTPQTSFNNESTSETYGPWMLVQRRKTKNSQISGKPSGHASSPTLGQHSRQSVHSTGILGPKNGRNTFYSRQGTHSSTSQPQQMSSQNTSTHLSTGKQQTLSKSLFHQLESSLGATTECDRP